MAKKEKTEDVVFNKDLILQSEKYREHRDLLGVLLQENEEYSFLQIEEMIENYTKGKVK